jgi:hypothetical protein
MTPIQGLRVGRLPTAVGALAILLASFFATLKWLDAGAESADPNPVSVRPAQWDVAGGASYEAKDGTVSMHGPGHVYAEAECPKPARCTIEFSIFVERAGTANIGLIFLRSNGSPTGETAVQPITGIAGRPAAISAQTPPQTRRVRAIVYSPTADAQVVFREPVLTITPES